jgi:hypothetical protein
MEEPREMVLGAKTSPVAALDQNFADVCEMLGTAVTGIGTSTGALVRATPAKVNAMISVDGVHTGMNRRAPTLSVLNVIVVEVPTSDPNAFAQPGRRR